MVEQLTRQLNLRTVMDLFVAVGRISRAELARRTGLSKQTVSELVGELEEGGWIRYTGDSVSSGASGRAAALYELDPSAGAIVGVDLGGTKINAALGDFSGAVLREATAPTDPRGGRYVIAQIVGLARELVAAEGVDPARLRVLALGSPGALDRDTGVMAFAPNIPSFGDLDVAREIAAELGTVVVVDNDVNIAALGEHWAGHGRGQSEFVFIAVGTGIGMGLITGGVLRTGATGAAGEIAYLPLGTDPFDPANQVKGPLEEAVAGEGLARRYAGGPAGRGSVPEIFAAAAAGEPAALAALDEEARLIALSICAVAAVLDPALAVIGGGIGSRPELLEPVRAWLARLMPRPVPVRTSELGPRAGLLGAVAVGLRTAHQRLFQAPGQSTAADRGPVPVPAPALDRVVTAAPVPVPVGG
ncbi:ROK family transcriptional regulator [Streptacidiphilus albus]|uniref:ROK family transcriptional regulator n=1 Tax=Streptacidiphilus albus TaxID=105425 RepID=UPI0006911414|nr:ROK family transcriptional regulator [Streptacidiphilus albus]